MENVTPREVTDSEGTTWSCVQAYAGLSQSSTDEKTDAARVEGENNKVYVVCTPSGGAQSVRLKLQSDWETEFSDEQLTKEIEAHDQSNSV